MSWEDYQPTKFGVTGSSLSTVPNNTPLLGEGWGNYAPVDYGIGDTGKVAGFGNMVGSPGTGSVGSGWGNWWDGVFGSTDTTTGMKTQGWGGAALGVAQGLGSAYMGMKQYGLAKQRLAMSKDQFNKNYEAQKTTTNASLEDRQRARVASNSGAYQSVGDYMNKNRIR